VNLKNWRREGGDVFEIRVSEDGVITLSGLITIKNIEKIYQEMIKIYNETQCVEINMAEVVEVDIAGLQMLLSFVRSFHEIGTNIKCITNPTVEETLEITGLRSSFYAA
jgi:anti-anti-sigma regulatory factor